MATKIIVIVGVSIAAVVFMFIMGKLADGKGAESEKKQSPSVKIWQETQCPAAK